MHADRRRKQSDGIISVLLPLTGWRWAYDSLGSGVMGKLLLNIFHPRKLRISCGVHGKPKYLYWTPRSIKVSMDSIWRLCSMYALYASMVSFLSILRCYTSQCGAECIFLCPGRKETCWSLSSLCKHSQHTDSYPSKCFAIDPFLGTLPIYPTRQQQR